MKLRTLFIAMLVMTGTPSCADEAPPPATMSLADLLPQGLVETLVGTSTGSQAGVKPNPEQALVAAALERTTHEVRYDAAYVKLDYPGGDVPDSMGVCTDVVIRSYRALGIDLQVDVHEDMVASFGAYPNHWGLTTPDSNIDHRRVPNLQTFFTRHGEKRKRSNDAADYRPGDIVTWNIGQGGKHVDHIGIVSNVLSEDQARYMVVHNIGEGPKRQDVLFRWPVTGHYRYFPSPKS